MDTSTDTMVRVPLLTGVVTVRDFVSTLLDLDADTALVFSHDQLDGGLTAREILIGKINEKRQWCFSGMRLWVAKIDEPYIRVTDTNINAPYQPSLYGCVTVRELILRLLGINPEHSLALAGGFYSLKLICGTIQEPTKYRYNHLFIPQVHTIWEN